MAITRAQQAKQMLQDGGMLVKPGFGGIRQGYKGPGERGGGDDASQDDFGGGPPGDGNRGDTTRDRIQKEKQRQFDIDRQRTLTGMFGDPDPEVNVPVGRRRDTITKFSNNLRANLRANPFSMLTPVGTLVKTSFQTNKAQQMMGLPGFSAQFDNPTRSDEKGETPLWMQLGYNSEAEYNAAMGRGVATSAPVESDPPVNLNRMAYRLMADGGAVIDDEPRQAYGLGDIVKKATRAVKKVVKSDIGKAALLYAATGGLGNLAQGQSFFTGFTSPTTFLGGARNIFTRQGAKNLLFGGEKLLGNPAKGNLVPFSGLIGKGGQLTGMGAARGLAAISALPLLGVGVEEDEEENEGLSPYLGEGLDIARIRSDPFGAMGQSYRLMAEGGDTEDAKEPVAKKVMPLLDMDGMEKDYRAEGGFVPIGRMEKADDVPARLSKNEFVFTADAVRNAGDGNVDKGAEVMYNMMKNLEAGGEVSEESQGLEGARRMFQTSKRLEEVL